VSEIVVWMKKIFVWVAFGLWKKLYSGANRVMNEKDKYWIRLRSVEKISKSN